MRIDERLNDAIEQLRQGQEHGFRILYDHTHNYVLMQARSILKNQSDANDLVQEVYINAYRSIDSLQDNEKIYAWLGGIAFRQATKLLRKEKDFPVGEEEAVWDTLVELDPDVQPEQAMDKKASAQILAEMIEELPPLQKSALLAYYYDEMSVGEIASAFSCSEGTIKSRLNYARKSLKEAIQRKEEKERICMHQLSLPLLLLAYGLLSSSTTIDAKTKEQIYHNSVQAITQEASVFGMKTVSGTTKHTGKKGIQKLVSKKLIGTMGMVFVLGGVGGWAGSNMLNQPEGIGEKIEKVNIVENTSLDAMEKNAKETMEMVTAITLPPTSTPIPTPKPTKVPTSKPEKTKTTITEAPKETVQKKITPQPKKQAVVTKAPQKKSSDDESFFLDAPGEISVE